MFISAFGSSKNHDNEAYEHDVYQLGLMLGKLPVTFYCGNNGGLLGSFMRGLTEAEDKACHVILCLCDSRKYISEHHFDEVMEFDTYFMRLEHLTSAELFLTFEGGLGTLTELLVSWNLIQANRLDKKILVYGDRVGAVSEHIFQQFVNQIRYPDIVFVLDSAQKITEAITQRVAQFESN